MFAVISVAFILWRVATSLSKAEKAFETRVLSGECQATLPNISSIQLLFVRITPIPSSCCFAEFANKSQKPPIPDRQHISGMIIGVTRSTASGGNESAY